MQSHHLSPSAFLRALGRAALALTAATASVVAQSQGFAYTGAIQTFTVPANVTSLYVDVRGGGGGSSIGPTTYPGGGGGVVHGHVQVTPGSELRILVGGRGADGANGRGGGGGGASYVAIGTSDAAFATPLLVGGGGAGASSHSGGLIGGSTMGGTGLGGTSATTGGGGGGLLAGGANGSGTAQGGAAATAGGLGGLGQNTGGNGGFGGGGGGGGPQGGGGAGGGGGGGYTGGNAPAVGGAIGGTSFVANVVQNPEVIAGLQVGNGFVTLLWGQAPWLVLGTGQTQTMVVPEGVTSATITAFGARGGNGRGPANTAEGPGGLGAAARATFAVAGGQTLRMRIGEPGQDVLPSAALAGGGGGGATVVALGSSDAAFGTPLLVAGGGGGGGGTPSGPRAGGAGGVVVGGTGNGGLARQAAGGGGLSVDGNGPGFGRATTNGSAGGAAIPSAGNGGYGGGGAGGNANAAFPNQGFGGGGGGYDGGDGAGTNDAASGGSSFFAAAGANVLSTPGGNTADYGRVEIVFAWPTASTNIAGTGCGTTPLALDADAGSLPRLPSTFVSRTTNIPATAVFTAVSIGLSDSVWSGGSLPMPLGSMGAPGCRLYQDAALGAFHLTTAAGAGTATFAFAIPDAPQIAGMDVFQQSWCADPTANGLGVVTSNKLRLRLGL